MAVLFFDGFLFRRVHLFVATLLVVGVGEGGFAENGGLFLDDAVVEFGFAHGDDEGVVFDGLFRVIVVFDFPFYGRKGAVAET